MSSDSTISSYLTTYNASQSSSTKSSDSDNSTLSMSDFISLLVAQLQNQDMYNTTDTTEFVSQMAQFSMVEAINEMKDQSMTASSFNLIGKGVTISSTDDDGNSVSDYGEVKGVSLYDGEVEVFVNGSYYSLDDVVEVFDASLLDS